MKVFEDISAIPLRKEGKKNVATIGVFDGVHLGHQHILKELVRRAKKDDAQSVIITFVNHPLEVLAPAYSPKLIMTPELRVKLLIEYGVDRVIPVRFSKGLADIEPEDFLKDIVVGQLGISKLLCGFNFRFGKDGKGDTELLRSLSKNYRIGVQIVPPILKKDLQVSSTKIRELLDDGMVRLAGELLTRPFSILGKVKKGVGRGRTIGYPTANIEPAEKLIIPASGVYAVGAKVAGRRYGGMMNIGQNPTFADVDFSMEIHLFAFKGSLVGSRLRVNFLERLRDEKRFRSVEGLVRQLKKDEHSARSIVEGWGSKRKS